MIKEIKKRISEKLFIKWLTYNSIILIISIIMFLLSFILSLQIIQNQITKAHLSSLNQVKQIVDSQLRNADKLFSEVELDNQIKEVMLYKNDYEPRHVLSMREIQKTLKSYKILNENIYDCYVYFFNHDFILSDDGKYNPEMFYNFSHNYFGLSYIEWYEMIKSKTYKAYHPTSIKINQGYKPIVLMERSISAYSDIFAKFIICLDGSLINRIIESTKWIENCGIVVLDQNNNTVFNPINTKIPEEIDYSLLNDDNSILYHKMDGKEAVITYTNSNVNNWKYISIIPKAVFFDEARRATRIILVILIVGVFLSAIISYYTTQKNYTPIRKIIKFIDSTWGNRYSLNPYELTKIENALYSVAEENKRMNVKIYSQSALMKNYFLGRLLKGEVYSTEFQEVQSEYTLQFTKVGYIVLFITVEMVMDIILSGDFSKVEEYESKAHFVIDNVFCELLKEKYIVEKTIVNNYQIFILNMDEDDSKEYRRDITDIFNKAEKFIRQNFKISISGYSSSYHIGLNSLNICYNEAVAVFERGILEGNEGIHFYSTLKTIQYNDGHINIIESEAQFIHCFTSGKFFKAKEYIKEIFDRSLFGNTISNEMKICREYVIINMMLSAIGSLVELHDRDMVKELKADKRLFSCKKVYDLYQEVIKLIEEVESVYNAEVNNNSTQEICRQAISLINENLTDSNLNVSMVADRLGVSVSYISRYFKQNIGISPLDYIHTLRIKQVKKLLEEGKHNLNKIAELVGYSNSLSLIRVFKKYEGITPGKLNQK